MCGICGVLNFTSATVAPNLLQGMTNVLRHRGPDEIGLYCDHQVGFGHTRLSIIDVSGGGQPMHTEDGTLHITFNGEIFNYLELRDELSKKGHRFATRSDTEVLLHLYQEEGEACVERLNGQWAFAIWDGPQRKLFLSRDRLGVRPLFYTQAAGSFLFASEMKALLACPMVACELDIQAINEIFSLWVTLPPRTAFRNILQLPPGHSLVAENGEVRTWQYWHLEYSPIDEISDSNDDRLAEELLALLLDATRIRLRSDVPVGAYLSGGLDSTLVTALVGKLAGDRLRTFSVSFQDAAFDESLQQEEASAYLKTEHSTLHCSYEDIARVLPEVIWHAEQPILRTAPAPLFLLSELVRDNGFKVVLTGEGADEVLGGYDIFKEAKIRRFWGRNPGSKIRPLLLRRLYPYMEGMQRQPRAYLENFFQVREEDLASPFFSHLPRWNLTSKLRMFLSPAVLADMQPGSALLEMERALPSRYASWDPFNQAEYLEAAYLLPGYILSAQGDRMAMAHSVESRHPFLDHRVVEFATKLPPRLKMKVLNQKYLLKQAAKGLIPESITKRHKQPYRAPDGKSMFSSGDGYVREMLSPDTIRRDGLFNAQAVSALVHKFETGRATGVRDDMAMIGILSTQLLVERFVNSHLTPHLQERV